MVLRTSLHLLLSSLLLLFISCSSTKDTSSSSSMTIAFGSCNHQWDEKQPIWKEITKNDPDLWIWLGDIIYADTDDMDKMRKDYEVQKSNTDYNYLRAASDVIGIWDDHDYGANDAGKEYSKKDSSKLLLFNFLDVPKEDSSWTRPGAYQSYSYEHGQLKVKVILLDVRYFRDSIGTRQASILGPQQWQWLIAELSNSDADVHVIGGGIQFLAEDHKFEKWANFPTDRKRLLQIIDILEVAHPILLSGDRHLGEMAIEKLPTSGKPILEITSSGLTHAYDDYTGEENRHRIGPAFPVRNFGILTIEKKGRLVSYSAEIRNLMNKVQYSIQSQELSRSLAKIQTGS